MKVENNVFEESIFTNVDVIDNRGISNGCLGGGYCDTLYCVSEQDEDIWISIKLLKQIFKNFHIFENVDYIDYYNEQEDAGEIYEHTELRIVGPLEDFNKLYKKYVLNENVDNVKTFALKK